MTNAMRLLGAQATGFDVSRQAIERARADFPRCDFHCCDITEFVSEPFEFVYCSEVIEHIANLETFMELLRRVSRPGTRVYVTTPDLNSPNVPHDIRHWDVFGLPEHVRFFDESALILLFSNSGFSPLRRWRDRKAGLKMMFRFEGAAVQR